MISRAELAKRFEVVEAQVAAACEHAHRPRSSVTLVAVSKKHPTELIRMAWELGHRDFGENYAQELRDKHKALQALRDLRWHAIGPVQPKNAKYIATAAHVFHALDELEVAQELSRRRLGKPLPCMIQVNVAQETSKAGLDISLVPQFLELLQGLPQLEVRGLTCMPPLVDDGELNRPYFERTRDLAAALGLPWLSMGTTADFAAAIEAGATHVRVGTALFGEREA